MKERGNNVKEKKPEEMTLEEKLDEIERLTKLAEDKAEIANLFAAYQYSHSVILEDETPDRLYAQHQPDVRHDWGGGVLEGLDELCRYYVNRPRYRGKLICHAIGNPVIEVAEDGQTAKGFWIAIGHETIPYPKAPTLEGDGDPFGPRTEPPDKRGIRKIIHWVWNKYGVDSIREDGQWRIWHLRTCELMRAPYHQDWVDFSLRNLIDNDMCGLHTPWQGVASTPLNAMPTRPSDDPRGGYRIDEPPLELPRLPEPYRTFSETFAY